MMAALNSRSQGRETSQGNMSTTISGVHTRANHLTLFADEYPESSNGTTISASVGYVGNLDVSRHSGVEMAIIAVRIVFSSVGLSYSRSNCRTRTSILRILTRSQNPGLITFNDNICMGLLIAKLQHTDDHRVPACLAIC